MLSAARPYWTIPLSSALPITNMASVCAGTEDSSSALGSVPAYEAILVQEFTPEPIPANKFALESVPEPTPVNESALESA